jgi:hypothetical protein
MLTSNEKNMLVFVKTKSLISNYYLSDPVPPSSWNEDSFFGFRSSSPKHNLMIKMSLDLNEPISEQGSCYKISHHQFWTMIQDFYFEILDQGFYFKELSVVVQSLNFSERIDSESFLFGKLIKLLEKANFISNLENKYCYGDEYFKSYSLLKCSEPLSLKGHYTGKQEVPSNNYLFCFGSKEYHEFLAEISSKSMMELESYFIKTEEKVAFNDIINASKALTFLNDYYLFLFKEVLLKFEQKESEASLVFKTLIFKTLQIDILLCIALGLVLPYNFFVNVAIVFCVGLIYDFVVKKFFLKL